MRNIQTQKNKIMEMSYVPLENLNSFQNYSQYQSVVVNSEFIDNPLSFPIAGQPLILVQRYALMTLMHTIIKKLIFQRYHNYFHSAYYKKNEGNFHLASHLADLMFVEKQKYNHEKYVAMFKEALFPVLRKMTPYKTSPLFHNYVKKLQYLNHLANLNPEKIS